MISAYILEEWWTVKRCVRKDGRLTFLLEDDSGILISSFRAPLPVPEVKVKHESGAIRRVYSDAPGYWPKFIRKAKPVKIRPWDFLCKTSAAVLVMSANSTRCLTINHPTNLSLPGGKSAPGGESPIDTAIRELREETGFQLDSSALIDVRAFDDGFGREVTFFLTVATDPGSVPNLEDSVPGTSDEFPEGIPCWAPLRELVGERSQARVLHGQLFAEVIPIIARLQLD